MTWKTRLTRSGASACVGGPQATISPWSRTYTMSHQRAPRLRPCRGGEYGAPQILHGAQQVKLAVDMKMVGRLVQYKQWTFLDQGPGY